MSKISAIILTKDSEKLIVNCLESVKFCNEIIVIDAGSKDRTVEIARSKGANVLFSEAGNYAQSRNLGLRNASSDWILYIDTDEIVSSELARNIKKAVSSSDKFSAYKLRRKNFYFGRNEWPYIEKLERLFKKESLKSWYGKIHESPIVEGKVGTLDGYLLHYTHRDLSSMVEKTLEWSKIEAELRFKANHPRMSWWRFPRVMVTAFLNSYIKQSGYKAGIVGLIESMYQTFSIFVTYARLWELQNKQSLRSDELKQSLRSNELKK